MFDLTSLADDTNLFEDRYEGILLCFLLEVIKNDYQDVRSAQVLWSHAHFIRKCGRERDSDALALACEVQNSLSMPFLSLMSLKCGYRYLNQNEEGSYWGKPGKGKGPIILSSCCKLNKALLH